MLTYAQNFEDVILARLFTELEDGFYIDVGACHPENLSVTKHFYDRGWNGINIEPIPVNHRLFDQCRPRDVNLNVAIDAHESERLFYEVIEYDALSTFDEKQARFLKESGYTLKTYPVPTRTLDSVFEDHVRRAVDFLKIDVEGAEEDVIGSIDLTKYRPRVLIVEAMQPGRAFPGWGNHRSVSNWPWEHTLISTGYTFAYYDGISRFYVRSEDCDLLLGRFELPPGCFDDIHRPEEVELSRQLMAARTLCEQRATSNAELAEDRDALMEKAEGLAEQKALVEKQLRAKEAELYALSIMTLRQRVAALGVYTRAQIKQVMQRALWRIASGRGRPPLPKITIVTPVRDGAAHIAETIESVLSQVYPSLEYFIVDGGSTDGTTEIIESYQRRTDFPHRISRWISEPDNGMYDAVAKGFEHATGEIFCYLNADDVFEGERLKSVGEYFADHPARSVIYHDDVVQVGGWKYPNAGQPKRVDTAALLAGHILFQDGVFFRREAYEAIGGIRRDLRFAGDFDLWLRLSAAYKFVRRPGHVSCFRVREGQLSSQMDRYHQEMRYAVTDFLASAPVSKRIRWHFGRLYQRAGRLAQRWRSQDRLFFPIDYANYPPPVDVVVQPAQSAPRSPIDGQVAEQFLFTTLDTRFGDREASFIYLDRRHGVAITHPPIERDKLDRLYAANYSTPPTELKHPNGTSPFRYFNRKRLWEKALLKLPYERAAGLFKNPWVDATFTELTAVLRKAEIRTTGPLRFLDTGCFEGKLLDEIAAKTKWRAFGLEPNLQAVGVARDKGHTVWNGHAEDAAEIVPPQQQFDVIFMGQTIEHMDDPINAAKRLRLLLAPGGAIVMSTPNLESREIDWFGPTWAHWHPPYHRYIFSRKGLRALATQAGLSMVCSRTYSHPYWTAMSIVQNQMGVAGAASHAVNFDESVLWSALRVFWLKTILFDRIGKGDYIYVVFKDSAQ